jgi:hypothetical protein
MSQNQTQPAADTQRTIDIDTLISHLETAAAEYRRLARMTGHYNATSETIRLTFLAKAEACEYLITRIEQGAI